jgi:hypothetical protein
MRARLATVPGKKGEAVDFDAPRDRKCCKAAIDSTPNGELPLGEQP